MNPKYLTNKQNILVSIINKLATDYDKPEKLSHLTM